MKIKSFVTLLLILLIIILKTLYDDNLYNVLEVTDDCKLGIDINKNGKITEDEYYTIKGINPLCSFDYMNNKSDELGNLEENQKIFIFQSVLNFYQKLFYNSKITIDNEEITLNGNNPALILLEKGFALAADDKYKKFENISAIEKLKKDGLKQDYYILNLKNNKYHTLNCKNGRLSAKKKYVLKDKLPDNAVPCKFCLADLYSLNNNGLKNKISELHTHIIEKSISENNITVIETIGANVYKPSDKCNSEICKSLKQQINLSKSSIDIALYELRNQPEIINALSAAKKRGVCIRFISDKSFPKTCSKEYEQIKNISTVYSDDGINKKYSRCLMHNKFFIFDNSVVWTGSTNVTSTGISGFDTNSAIVIKSKQVAENYTKEFENFLNGTYHNDKEKIIQSRINLKNTDLDIYFSPKDKVISNKIIPEIEKAKSCIYVPAFIITHKQFAEELIKAHKRGIEVKVIIDATSARNKYSVHSLLRQNGILVKTENFAGKLHMKSVLIDDSIAFLGSMNFTKSGNVYNDENSLKIVNKNIVTKLKANFIDIWNKIPDKYLTKDPAAESFDSIGSCFDGVDNDFDGYIDTFDSGCKDVKR